MLRSRKVLSVSLLVVVVAMFIVSAALPVYAQPTPVPVTPFEFQTMLNSGFTLFNQIGLMEVILVMVAIGIAAAIFRRFRRAAG